MTERRKLTVLEVKPPQKVGDKGAEKVEFRAKWEDKDSGLKYLTFRKPLFDAIKPGAVLDAEVEIKDREFDGNIYTDRNVVQLYQEGRPLGGPTAGRQFGRSPEERSSIERQVALKASIESVATKIDDSQIEAILARASIFAAFLAGDKEFASPKWVVEPSPAKPAPAEPRAQPSEESPFLVGVEAKTAKRVRDYLTRATVSPKQAQEFLGCSLAEWFALGKTESTAIGQIGERRQTERNGGKHGNIEG